MAGGKRAGAATWRPLQPTYRDGLLEGHGDVRGGYPGVCDPGGRARHVQGEVARSCRKPARLGHDYGHDGRVELLRHRHRPWKSQAQSRHVWTRPRPSTNEGLPRPTRAQLLPSPCEGRRDGTARRHGHQDPAVLHRRRRRAEPGLQGGHQRLLHVLPPPAGSIVCGVVGVANNGEGDG